jgi:hypothetical protein
MRWLPYRRNSPDFLAGKTGRWQVYYNHGWSNAITPPAAQPWRPLNSSSEHLAKAAKTNAAKEAQAAAEIFIRRVMRLLKTNVYDHQVADIAARVLSALPALSARSKKEGE